MKKQVKREHKPFISFETFLTIPLLLLLLAISLLLYPDLKMLFPVLPEILSTKPVSHIPADGSDPSRTVPVPRPTQSWDCEKISDKTTACAHPADERMSTIEELNIALNEFRKSHGLNTLEQNGTLCTIAQNRAIELHAQGALDEHEGFEKYAKGQNEFQSMGEVLYGGVQPQYGVHIVEWGWARSLTGHKEAMLNPKWQYGCSGISGYFAVYVFGQKP